MPEPTECGTGAGVLVGTNSLSDSPLYNLYWAYGKACGQLPAVTNGTLTGEFPLEAYLLSYYQTLIEATLIDEGYEIILEPKIATF